MDGTLDIRRISNLSSTVDVYQVRYEDLAGDSFSASMNRDELRDLMYRKIALDLTDEELDQTFDRVLREGHVIFPEIQLRDNELAAAGLRYLPVEG